MRAIWATLAAAVLAVAATSCGSDDDTVASIGSDPHKLDTDHDGIACES